MAYQPGQSWATPPPAPSLNIAGGQGQPMPMGGGMGGMPPAAPGGHVMMPTTPTPGLTMHPNGYAQGAGWQGAGQVPPTPIKPSGAGVAGAATALATKET
jgi:hypothetical protein